MLGCSRKSTNHDNTWLCSVSLVVYNPYISTDRAEKDIMSQKNQYYPPEHW
jgi:hypothetical protein